MEKGKGNSHLSIKVLSAVQLFTCVAILILCIFGKGWIQNIYQQINIAYQDMIDNSVIGEKISEWTDTGKDWINSAEQIVGWRSPEPVTWDEWVKEVDEFLRQKKEELEESSSFFERTHLINNNLPNVFFI